MLVPTSRLSRTIQIHGLRTQLGCCIEVSLPGCPVYWWLNSMAVKENSTDCLTILQLVRAYSNVPLQSASVNTIRFVGFVRSLSIRSFRFVDIWAAHRTLTSDTSVRAKDRSPSALLTSRSSREHLNTNWSAAVLTAKVNFQTGIAQANKRERN